jgi:DNA polymerase III subunit delta'
MVEQHSPQLQMLETLKPMFVNKHLPQSILLVGAQPVDLISFAKDCIANFYCISSNGCGTCRQCVMIQEGTHPDLQFVTQESPDKAIKVDQIRDIQQNIYQTPQCTTHRFIVIHRACKMNQAAANALLKVLEEPPKHSLFMLLAEQVHNLPATVMSRCQKYVFKDQVDTAILNHIHLYDKDSSRSKLFGDTTNLLTDLVDLFSGKQNICAMSAKWKDVMLDDLLWGFYLINAQLIHGHYYVSPNQEQSTTEQLEYLSKQLTPMALFTLNDKLCVLRKKLNNSLSVNQLLSIEDLLLDYVKLRLVEGS